MEIKFIVKMSCSNCFTMFLTMVMVFWMFILWTILLVCKVDAAVDWPWYYINIPLWLSFPGIFMWSSYLFHDIRHSKKGWLGALVWLVICGSGIVLFTVLLSIKLELQTNFISWWWVFCPLWVSLVLLYVVDEDWPDYEFNFHYPVYYDKTYSYQRRYETFYSFLRILPWHTLSAIIVFTFLLVIDLEGIYSTPWAIKFIPFWWLICLVWLLVLTGIIIKPTSFLDVVVFPILSISIPMVFILLLGLYLSGVIETYLAVVWIPFWIVEVIFLFVSMSLCCWANNCC